MLKIAPPKGPRAKASLVLKVKNETIKIGKIKNVGMCNF